VRLFGILINFFKYDFLVVNLIRNCEVNQLLYETGYLVDKKQRHRLKLFQFSHICIFTKSKGSKLAQIN
jgi:hypothetical protein